MNGYVPKDERYRHLAERERIARSPQSLRRELALLAEEERWEREKLRWQIKQSELRGKALEELARLHHEKRLSAMERYAREELSRVKLSLSATAEAMERFLTRTKEGRRLRRQVLEADDFAELPAPLRSSILQAEQERHFASMGEKALRPSQRPGEIGGVGLESARAELRAEMRELRNDIADYVSIGEQVGKNLARGIRDGEPFLRAALKNLLLAMVDFLERFAIAAQLERALANFAALGPAGLLAAAAETAVIAGLLETAKGKILAFAKGGIIEEPVAGIGLRSKKKYLLGEKGPEAVVPLETMRRQTTLHEPARVSPLRPPSAPSVWGTDAVPLIIKELKALRSDLGSLRLSVGGNELALVLERAGRSGKERLR